MRGYNLLKLFTVTFITIFTIITHAHIHHIF